MPASGTADGTEKAASASSGPGGRLRQAREAQGLQLEEVANELRVGAASLVALEENRFDALGAAVFARGYLKQYGTRLGLDVRELLTLYERSVGESEVALAPTKGIRLRDERQVSLWALAAFALVLVVGGLSYWWWRQSEIDSMALSAGVSSDADAPSPEQENEPAVEPEIEAALAGQPPEVVENASPAAAASKNLCRKRAGNWEAGIFLRTSCSIRPTSQPPTCPRCIAPPTRLSCRRVARAGRVH